MSSIDQQFVEFVVKSLVGSPDDVHVERRIDEKGVLLELTVAPEDLGRVIGKRGATAQSLRTLLRALGTKNDARYNLKIVDNGIAGDQASSGGSSSSDDDAKAHVSDDRVAHAISDDDDAELAALDHNVHPPRGEHSSSDVVNKTRKELADLDDLDV